jgi:hypothetical protein
MTACHGARGVATGLENRTTCTWRVIRKSRKNYVDGDCALFPFHGLAKFGYKSKVIGFESL